MSVATLLRLPVTIQRATLADDAYGGEDERSWAAPDETLTLGELQPIVNITGERPDADPTVTRWRMFLPAGTDVRATDRVVAAGDTFEVDGQPVTVLRLGSPLYVRLTLRKVT